MAERITINPTESDQPKRSLFDFFRRRALSHLIALGLGMLIMTIHQECDKDSKRIERKMPEENRSNSACKPDPIQNLRIRMKQVVQPDPPPEEPNETEINNAFAKTVFNSNSEKYAQMGRDHIASGAKKESPVIAACSRVMKAYKRGVAEVFFTNINVKEKREWLEKNGDEFFDPEKIEEIELLLRAFEHYQENPNKQTLCDLLRAGFYEEGSPVFPPLPGNVSEALGDIPIFLTHGLGGSPPIMREKCNE